MRGTQSPDAKVMLVDDDPAMLRLLAKWLENSGYQVCTVGSAQEAIQVLQTECPGVLITDWDMPEMDGLDLCRWLRSHPLPRYVYTFLLTVRTGTSDIVKGLEAGADDFLKKPVDRHELLARLRSGSRVLELETRLSETARRDPLTGLLTQRALFERMMSEWQRASRYRCPLACVMLDIDFFKRINDDHGHTVGDAAIRAVAAWLQRNVRSSDIVSRYGGEEFCIILPETGEQQAMVWAERVRTQLAEESKKIAGLDLTISLGVAQRMDDTRSPEQLVDMADQALLVAKRAGRNRSIGFESICDANLSGSSKSPGMMFRGAVARDVMTPVVAGLHQDETIERAAEYFLRFHVTLAPIVDDDGKLVGTLTEKDLLESMLSEGWCGKPVREVMNSTVIWYDEETPVMAIYEFLCRVSLRSVIIVNDNKPTGVISRGVILRWSRNMAAVEEKAAQHQTGDNSPPMTDEPPTEIEGQREALIAVVDAILDEGTKIREALQKTQHDAARHGIVGGASRVQELVAELLASAHWLDREIRCGDHPLVALDVPC